MHNDVDPIVEEVEETGDYANIRMMWRAAIAQALRDLVCINIEDALDAAQWIGSPDFQETCDHAAMDAVWLEQEIRGHLAKKEPYRRYHLIKLSQQINIGLTSGDNRDND